MYHEPGKPPQSPPRDPFKFCVSPRPLGGIAAVDAQRRNKLAPYRQCRSMRLDLTIVMFSAKQTTQSECKDSLRNAETTGRFLWNIATCAPREATNVGIEEGPHSLVAAMTIQPKARMGLGNEASIDNRFQTDIPGNGEALLAGLEGPPRQSSARSLLPLSAARPFSKRTSNHREPLPTQHR